MKLSSLRIVRAITAALANGTISAEICETIGEALSDAGIDLDNEADGYDVVHGQALLELADCFERAVDEADLTANA